MSAANYKCPQCSGHLNGTDGEFECEDCGMNISEVLEHVSDRGGPLADVARQLQEALQK